eukprot:scaffold56150_cov49-Phaeocystis_antarctica.AAC.2
MALPICGSASTTLPVCPASVGRTRTATRIGDAPSVMPDPCSGAAVGDINGALQTQFLGPKWEPSARSVIGGYMADELDFIMSRHQLVESLFAGDKKGHSS